MANSRIGIKRALISPYGVMATPLPWPTGGLITMGSRKASNLLISPLDELTDYRQKKLRNKTNFKYEVDSFQLHMRDLQWLILFVQDGYDFQLVKEAQSSSNPASGGIFNWAQQKNGLGFEYTMTNKERFCKVKFETALEYANAQALITAAKSYNSVLPAISADPISGGNERGENLSLVKYPWYLAIQSPDGTEIFNKKEIIERSFRFSTKGIKNEYNEDVIHWITVELKIKGSDATIDKIENILAKDMSPSLTIKENLTSTTFEKFSFAANVLTHSDDFQLGDEQDFSQLTFAGDIALDQIAFAYGATNGGVGVDEGEVDFSEAEARQGGTFNFGDAV